MLYGFVGVDPGIHGAIAFYDPAEDELQVIDMPLVTFKVGGKKKSAIDVEALAAWVDQRATRIKRAAIEEVHAMPGQGVTSMFRFGQAHGIAMATLMAFMIPTVRVRPRAWKSYFGLTSNKDASRSMASQHFPCSEHLWARKKDDGRAEAALLSLYCSKLK